MSNTNAISSRRKKQTYHHGDLKNALVAMGTEMIEREGVEAVSLRKVGNKLGVSQAALYKHFADKQALLHAVAVVSYERLIEAQRQSDEEAVEPTDKISAQGAAYVRFALEHPHLYRLMFGQLFAAGENDTELQACRKRSFIILQRAVADALADGDTHLDVATAVVGARVIVHGLASLLIDGTLSPGKSLTRNQEEALVQRLTSFYAQSLKLKN